MSVVAERISDGAVLGLIKQWLKAAVVEEAIGRALPNVVDPSELSHETQAVSLIDHDRCVR